MMLFIPDTWNLQLTGSPDEGSREIPIGCGKRHVEVTTEGTASGPSVPLARVTVPTDMWLKGMFKQQYIYLINRPP